MTLEIHPIAGSLGAELRGPDLSQPLDDAATGAVLDALYEHKVIFFRGQELTPEQQIAFSARLGPVFTDHPAYLPTMEGHPEVVVLDGFSCDSPKTKPFAQMLSAVGVDRGCVFALHEQSRNAHLSGRNIPKTDVRLVGELNAYEVLRRSKLVFTKTAFENLLAGGETSSDS